ncbi:unnamed protein product [Urochloa humidicola]
MESGEIRTRFGRCPYCRAMIYQDPEAVIYYCSKCRTPIRGKNLEATEENALSRLEILSADTASVFSDDLDAYQNPASVLDVHGDQQPPLFSNPSSYSNSTANSRVDDRVHSNGHDEKLRPSSRRTRRSACSDSFVLRYGVFMSSRSETEGGFSSSPRSANGRQRRRSLAGIQELEASTAGWSRPAAPPPSPLADPGFQRDLLRSLDALRGLIAAIEPPASNGATAAAARSGARFFRRLETHLARAEYPSTSRNAGGGSAGSSSSGSSSAGGRGERRRRKQHHCRHFLGGAPFVVCGGCSELLQVPATTPLSRRKVARLRCGGCDEVLELTSPTGVAGSAASYQTTLMSLSALPESDNAGSCSGSVGGGGAQPLPLHRALGYSSPSPLLQSRRY